MGEDAEKLRRELEEVRAMREELQQLREKMQTLDDVEMLREEIEEMKQEAEELRRESDRGSRHRFVHPERPAPPPRAPRAPKVKVDLSGITDSLETAMDQIGDQVAEALKGLEGLEGAMYFPDMKLFTSRKRRKAGRRNIEQIPPDRIAKVISPLGSEERLRILDYLKSGGKSFNELETETGKTGSSLTHHLNPLLEAGYVIKGQVRGTYYLAVEGRLAYKLAQWITSQVELQVEKRGNGSDQKPSGDGEREVVRIDFEDSDELDELRDELDEHLDGVEETLDDVESDLEDHEDEEDEEEEEEDDW